MIDHDEIERLKTLIEDIAEQEQGLYVPAFWADGKRGKNLNEQLSTLKKQKRYHLLEILNIISSKRSFWENILGEAILTEFENL